MDNSVTKPAFQQTGLRMYTMREVTLILYKAAEIQDSTWWARSLHLSLRPRLAFVEPVDLTVVQGLGEEMGISGSVIKEAEKLVPGPGPEGWVAT